MLYSSEGKQADDSSSRATKGKVSSEVRQHSTLMLSMPYHIIIKQNRASTNNYVLRLVLINRIKLKDVQFAMIEEKILISEHSNDLRIDY